MWSTSSRNPVAFLVLKEMSSQKIYLQDYITVCSNSVYIYSLSISIISFRASLTEQVLPYIQSREVVDFIYYHFALSRQYYILMASPLLSGYDVASHRPLMSADHLQACIFLEVCSQ